MAVIISNIRLPLQSGDAEAIEVASRQLKAPKNSIQKAYVTKRSPDFRHKASPGMVFSVGFELESERLEEAAVRTAASQSVMRRNPVLFAPVPGHEPLSGRPVVAGFGPAGMFAGLLLAKAGYRPLIVERGADVDTRVADVEHFWSSGVLNRESNVQFGEGGAGTFSDGKLTTRINDKLCDTVLEEFIRHGAPDTIRMQAKPHIGTDKLRGIVKSIRQSILEYGGEIRFQTRLEGIGMQSSRVRSVTLSSGETIETDAVILAVGHSARDTFSLLLKKGIRLEPKPFSAGVRIEHLQKDIDRMLYGSYAGHPNLPKGEYQLSWRQGERAVYTFCMCPGGTVVAAASEEGGVVTNGMSEFSRSGRNANAAVVVSLEAFPSPLDGIAFQRSLETAAYLAGGVGYAAPVQTLGAFFEGKADFRPGRVLPTYPAGIVPARVDTLLPEEITNLMKTGLRVFDRKLPGYASPDALLTGVETRTSSPVRIPRNDRFVALGADGLYPTGEGAGYAGGIMSAAVDGLRVAGAIVERYAPLT